MPSPKAKFVINYTTKMEEGRKLYEIGYFLVSTLKEDEIPSALDSIKSELAKFGAEVKTEIFPKLRKLAYPIKHENEGYFGWMHIEAQTDKINEISRYLWMNDKILRHIIIEVTKRQLAQMELNKSRSSVRRKKDEPMEDVIKEGGKSYVEEKKVELEELDEKLEEILNK